jgi:twitching motility protein PilT
MALDSEILSDEIHASSEVQKISLEKAVRFSDIEFSDLIIGPTRQDSFLKNVANLHGLQMVPESLEPVLRALRKQLDTISRTEFPLTLDLIQYRGSTMDTVDGRFYVLRRGMTELPNLFSLGIPAPVAAQLLNPKRSHGLVLFSGPMGSGKTTSASSFLVQRLLRYGGHAVSLEDPPELPIHGPHGTGMCFQTDVPDSDFGTALVRVLRFAAPEIIYIGELRESRAVCQALRAAVNGHLIIATIHGSGIIESLDRVLALGREHDGESAADLLADGLSAVIHQTLEGLPKKLKTQFLFTTHATSDSTRAKIRAGGTIQLGTEIQAQRNRLILHNQRRCS